MQVGRRWSLAAFSAVGVLLIAACGDDGDDDTAGGDATETTVEDTTTTTTEGDEAGDPDEGDADEGELEERAEEALEEEQSAEGIVETAAVEGNFDAFFELARTTGVATELQGPGPFTVFLPEDDTLTTTFSEQAREELEQNTDVLTRLIRYHIVDEALSQDDLEAGMEIETLEGGTLAVSSQDGDLLINDKASITRTIEASNGMIFVIDDVLIPEGVEADGQD